MASITEIKSLLGTYREKMSNINATIAVLDNLFSEYSARCIICDSTHYSNEKYDHSIIPMIYVGFVDNEIEIFDFGYSRLVFNEKGLIKVPAGNDSIQSFSFEEKKYILRNLDIVFEKIQNFLKESIEKMNDLQAPIGKIQDIVKGLRKEGE